MIEKFFTHDIHRSIETVIKADDREHIATEVAEYVITREISKKITDFFQAYKDYQGANGVWISGFFGSGKSHLLKILSYVLENKAFDGHKSGEVFAQKITDDPMLKADVQAATRIPSESILFNIDQQAQIGSKSDANAILAVFYKVFFDHLGFYGFQPHVAEFEMWVHKNGHYDQFKTRFATHFDKSWEEARIDYFDPMVTDAIAATLGELHNTDATKYETILDDIEDRQKQSIEGFCDYVNDYLQTKTKGFRLNFFVDEVGQYISNNTKLMLNLQTIAETLATKTRGHAWILVTSQEDMEKVVGDMNKNQQNDFSRIQARFKIKVPLTSANVDEVIEKRLLTKNPEGQQTFQQAYHKREAHLKSLLSFSEIGVQFKGYANDTDYANKYPFVPYQFDLFQQCRRALSTHNAFQGKHASVGERSMLGVFQQVVRELVANSQKTLVSFDMMYAGIRNELRGEIQSTVILAESNLSDAMAIRVLKALFLVKYFSNFKATRRNVSVLLIDDININIKQHNKRIETALNTLENQSYVQRNGEVYEFLTDDEKDIEQEIKSTDIEEQAVTQLMKQLFFDDLIRDTKIKYLDNKQEYDFTAKVDGITFGRDKELYIEIITENNAQYNPDTPLLGATMGHTGLLQLVLGSNNLFMRDLRMFLRTEKYYKQNQSTANRPEVKRILQEKAQQNDERRRNLLIMAKKLLAEAPAFVNGSPLDGGHSSDGKTRVINAFQDLIKIAYPNLRMLGEGLMNENSVKNTLRSRQDDLFSADDASMTEAESEIEGLIQRRKRQSDRTSLNDIKNKFSKKPYGWYSYAIWTVVGRLYKRGKVELKQDARLLDDEEVLSALLNSSSYGNTLLELQAMVDPKQLKQLRELYTEAFDESCPVSEAKEVANVFKDKLKELHQSVNALINRQYNFPFLRQLAPTAQTLQKLINKEYLYFLTQTTEFEDELLDAKEQLIDPIKKFINGDQGSIYSEIRALLNGDTSNFDYIEGDELDLLHSLMAHDAPYRGDLIRQAKQAKDTLQSKVEERLSHEQSVAEQMIQHAIQQLEQKEEFGQLSNHQQAVILAPLKKALEKAKSSNYIAVIRETAAKVREELLTQQLNAMLRQAAPPKPQPSAKTSETTATTTSYNTNPDTSPSVAAEPAVQYVKRNRIGVTFAQNELRTEEDVDAYVEALREALKKEIQNNRRIQL
ncbi:MAG TPA: BREX system P-loop protein BrxC [Microscillaceae bacterium]|nr:BREX system P-loop protein BrxC [Microscillaceae bacterium]